MNMRGRYITLVIHHTDPTPNDLKIIRDLDFSQSFKLYIQSLMYSATPPPRLHVRGLLMRPKLRIVKTFESIWAGNQVSVIAAMSILLVRLYVELMI